MANNVSSAANSTADWMVETSDTVRDTISPYAEAGRDIGETIRDVGAVGLAFKPKSKTLRRIYEAGSALEAGSQAFEGHADELQQDTRDLREKVQTWEPRKEGYRKYASMRKEEEMEEARRREEANRPKPKVHQPTSTSSKKKKRSRNGLPPFVTSRRRK
jgi:hypothetical protein